MLKIDKRGVDAAIRILDGEGVGDIASEYGISKQRVMELANRATGEMIYSYKGLVSECGCWQCLCSRERYSHSMRFCLKAPVVWRAAFAMYKEMEKKDAAMFNPLA